MTEWRFTNSVEDKFKLNDQTKLWSNLRTYNIIL